MDQSILDTETFEKSQLVGIGMPSLVRKMNMLILNIIAEYCWIIGAFNGLW
jgi:hypothetical protein